MIFRSRVEFCRVVGNEGVAMMMMTTVYYKVWIRYSSWWHPHIVVPLFPNRPEFLLRARMTMTLLFSCYHCEKSMHRFLIFSIPSIATKIVVPVEDKSSTIMTTTNYSDCPPLLPHRPIDSKIRVPWFVVVVDYFVWLVYIDAMHHDIENIQSNDVSDVE